jgi:excisionase family DNA binding protein
MEIKVRNDGGDPAAADALREAIEPLINGLHEDIQGLREEVAELRLELRQEIHQLRGERSSVAMLSVTEAAAIAGISERTMQTLIHAKEVPSAKIGRRRLIPKKAFFAWLRSQVEGVSDAP